MPTKISGLMGPSPAAKMPLDFKLQVEAQPPGLKAL